MDGRTGGWMEGQMDGWLDGGGGLIVEERKFRTLLQPALLT